MAEYRQPGDPLFDGAEALEYYNERVIACPDCDGEGWLNGRPRPYEILPDHQRCRMCGGTGEVEVTFEPITLEDLENTNAPLNC